MTLAGTASLALHGVILLAIGLAAEHTARSQRSAPIEIEVIAASPPASPQPTPQPAPQPAPPAVRTASTAAPLHGRRGQAVAQRVPSRPTSARSAIDGLTVRYDDPSSFAASDDTAGDGEHGRGAQGAGLGQFHDDLPRMEVPPPPGSLARPPRPRRDYHRLQLHSVRQFAGRSIKVLLSVDERGRVRDVRLLQGVNADLDQRTIELTRNFEFEPALDETGAPVPGSSRWEIAIVDETNPGLREALRRGYY